MVKTSIRLALYSDDAWISSLSSSEEIVLKGILSEKFMVRASLNSLAINGVCEAPEIATETLFSYFAIATPTIAYLLAGFGNFI